MCPADRLDPPAQRDAAMARLDPVAVFETAGELRRNFVSMSASISKWNRRPFPMVLGAILMLVLAQFVALAHGCETDGAGAARTTVAFHGGDGTHGPAGALLCFAQATSTHPGAAPEPPVPAFQETPVLFAVPPVVPKPRSALSTGTLTDRASAQPPPPLLLFGHLRI